jgi:class 3 adenylate cyclase
MYAIERNAGGLPGTLRRLVDGEERPVDTQADYVETFASAVVGLADRAPIGNPWLPPIDVLFEGKDELVRYCKDHVVKLVVRRDDAGRDALGHGRSAHGPQRTGRIFSLLIAIAPLPGSAASGEEVDGVVGTESNLWVPEGLDQLLAGELDDEASDLRRLSNRPIRRAFLYVDISDFSGFRPGQQSLMVTALAGVVHRRDFWTGQPLVERALGDLEAMLCVGDGYIFVFRDSANATYFAAHMASLLEILVARTLVPVEIHFRMGVHVGPVYCFWDPGRNGWNYIGEGINGGQRVLSVIGRETDDVLFISSRVRQELLASSDEDGPARLILSNVQNKGRRRDKHGNPWRVYEVNHTNLMSEHVRSLKWITAEL